MNITLMLIIMGVSCITCPITIAVGADILKWMHKYSVHSFAMPCVYFLNSCLNVLGIWIAYKLVEHFYGY